MADLSTRRLVVLVGVIALFGIITFILAAATLGTLNKRYNDLKNIINSVNTVTNTTTSSPSLQSVLAESIRIDDLMYHMNELQRIASDSNQTRAIGTPGFDATVKYIEDHLKKNAPNLIVSRQAFPVRNFSIQGQPVLNLWNNVSSIPFTYSTDLPRADFTHVTNSGSINRTQFYISVVLNNGCNRTDWQNVAGRAALVRAGGPCTYAEKGELASNLSVSALLFYNSGATTSNLAPATIRLRQANILPALALSYAVGQRLINEANRTDVTVEIEIQLATNAAYLVDNICADTMDGSSSETIVIGSHSDSVPAGPGINDNGSY